MIHAFEVDDYETLKFQLWADEASVVELNQPFVSSARLPRFARAHNYNRRDTHGDNGPTMTRGGGGGHYTRKL